MKSVEHRRYDRDAHDPRSIAIVHELAEIEEDDLDDGMLGLKPRVDKYDYGEYLMYLLDIYFERKGKV